MALLEFKQCAELLNMNIEKGDSLSLYSPSNTPGTSFLNKCDSKKDLVLLHTIEDFAALHKRQRITSANAYHNILVVDKII